MKRFVVEIEEGKTTCEDCPFSVRVWHEHWEKYEYKCGVNNFNPDCFQYNMQTIKILEQEKEVKPSVEEKLTELENRIKSLEDNLVLMLDR